MHRLASISLIFGLLTSAHAAPPQDKLSKQFVGAWRLVTIEGNSPRAPRKMDQPSGIIMYDPSGWMSAQISFLKDRKAFTKGFPAATVDEKATAFESFVAYYGTYTVDPKQGTITHHLEGGTEPGRQGADNIRYYEFKGNNRVILMPVEDGKGGRINRKDATYKLTWERIK